MICSFAKLLLTRKGTFRIILLIYSSTPDGDSRYQTVINARLDGDWGAEVRPLYPNFQVCYSGLLRKIIVTDLNIAPLQSYLNTFQHGSSFEITVECEERAYLISIDGEPLIANFPYRGKLSTATTAVLLGGSSGFSWGDQVRFEVRFFAKLLTNANVIIFYFIRKF